MNAAIDFGNENTVVCLPTRNGIDLIQDPESRRVMPTLVTFGDDRRFWGSAAEREQMKFTSGTISQLKKLIGLPFSSATRSSIASEFGLTLTELEDGLTGIEVTFRDAKFILRPEQVLAYLIKSIDSLVRARDSRSHRYVMTVSPSWNDTQRRIVMDAFRIAGKPCVSLVNSTTAAVACYAMKHRNKLPLKESAPALFLDFGSSCLTAAVVHLKVGMVQMRSFAVDPELGGTEFTNLLMRYLLSKVQQIYKIDPTTNPRAMIRFRRATEKLKKTLSVNPIVPFEVPNLPGDVDVSFFVKREEFVSQIEDRVNRISESIERALELAHLKIQDIRAVEILGGGSRIPLIREKVAAIVGREPTQSLDADECCGIGAGYIAAIMSPAFRLQLAVSDVLSVPVTARWGDHREIVFDQLTALPGTSTVTVKAAGHLVISIFSGEEEIGKLNVDIESESEVDAVIRFQLSISSIVDVESVSVNNHSQPFSVEWRGQATQEKIVAMADIEEVMAAADRGEELIDEAKNSLEAALFALEAELREHSDFLSSAEKENAEEVLCTIRNWAEENEFDRLAVEEYDKRLALLHTCADPIARRRRKYEERCDRVETLKKRIALVGKALDEDVTHRSNHEWRVLKNLVSQITEQLESCEACGKLDECRFDVDELGPAVEDATRRQARLKAVSTPELPIGERNFDCSERKDGRNGRQSRSARSGSRCGERGNPDRNCRTVKLR
jgi:molecular chaperone DnaK (HSP70)